MAVLGASGCTGLDPRLGREVTGSSISAFDQAITLEQAKISTFSFPHRAELSSGVRSNGHLFLAGYIDRLRPSREDAFIVRHDGIKAQSVAEIDSGLPGYKAAWAPTSPAYFRPDMLYDITTLNDGSIVAVGNQYNVPSRWSTVSGGSSSADLLLVKLRNNKEEFRKRWKPGDAGYHDTIGLIVERSDSGSFVVVGSTAKSRGPHVEPVITRQSCFLHHYHSDGSRRLNLLFAEQSVPLACSISRDAKLCYVVTQDTPKYRAKVDVKAGMNLFLEKIDLGTGKAISRERIFKSGESELVSNVVVLEDGTVFILYGLQKDNDQGFPIWDGAAYMLIVDPSSKRNRIKLPDAGRISTAWPFATTTKFKSSLLIALKLHHFSGRTPAYGVYESKADGVLKLLATVESNQLGGDPKRGRTGRCVALMANESSIDMLVQVEWSKALTKYAVAEFRRKN